jgi:hypothetical protein
MTAGTLYCRRMCAGTRRGWRRDVGDRFNSSADNKRVSHLDCFAMKDQQSDALFGATGLQNPFIGSRDAARAIGQISWL